MNYLALALSFAALAATLYVYFKGAKRMAAIENELEELLPILGDDPKNPAAPRLPGARF